MNTKISILKNQRRAKYLLFAFLLLSIIFLTFTFHLPSSDEIILITNLIFLQYSSLEPFIIIVFYLMGIWPAIQATLLYGDGKEKRVPMWPFILGSFIGGAYILTIYLLLRENKEGRVQHNKIKKFLDSKIWRSSLVILTISLFILAFFLGNPLNYIDMFQKSLFIRVMTIDFLLFTLITPMTIYIHSVNNSTGVPTYVLILGLVPLLGALFYVLKFHKPS